MGKGGSKKMFTHLVRKKKKWLTEFGDVKFGGGGTMSRERLVYLSGGKEFRIRKNRLTEIYQGEK